MKEIHLEMKQQDLSMEIDRKVFAMALKTWRLRKNLTQLMVGKMFGVSRFTIMRAEAGKPITWEIAYRLFARLSQELRKEVEQ